MKRRKLINEKVKEVVLSIAILTTIVVGAVSLIAMLGISNRSKDALVEQLGVTLDNLIDSRVEIADSKILKYKSYMIGCQDAVELLYSEPNSFTKKYVPPYAETDFSKEYVMQRSVANKQVDKEAFRDDISLLSNLEYFMHSIMKKDSLHITAIYFGHEKGFSLSYDNHKFSKGIPDEDGEIYFNFFERPWYKNTIKGDKIIFSNLEQDYFGRGLTLTCSAPMKKDGKNIGVIAMDILVTDLQKDVVDVDVGEGAYSFIVDVNGNIVASPFVSIDAKEFENITSKNSPINDVSFNIMHDMQGVIFSECGYYIAYKKCTATDWILCIAMPEKLVMEPVDEINRSIFLIVGIFIFILVVICVVVRVVANSFSNRLVKPIIVLKKDVEIIAKGDFDKKADESGDDEISDLAKSFNRMTVSLKKYILDLTNVTKEKERIGAELNVATEIQASMLPNVFPAFPNYDSFDIYASMHPAKEVGGDFYDFFMIDNKHIAIVVADVSGKGVPAALFMVIGKTLIKDHTSLNADLGSVFTNVNNLLCEANKAGLFITAFEAVIDLSNGEVKYVNAGHEMPFIYKKGEGFKPFNMKPGFVLAGMEDMIYNAGTIKMEPGDRIFQYTDGVTEATNIKNELYGMERLEKVLNENTNENPSGLIEAVKKDIDKFVGEAPQFDDITMLAFDLKKYL